MPARLSKSTAAASSRKRKRKSQKHAPTVPLLPPDIAEDDIEISDEDIRFVTKNRKNAGFLSNLDTYTITKQVLGLKSARKEEENLEVYYEKKVKCALPSQEEDGKVDSVEPADVLPIKTLSGELQYYTSNLEKGEGKKQSSLSFEERKLLVRRAKDAVVLQKKPDDELPAGTEPVQNDRMEASSEGKQMSKGDRKREQKSAQKMGRQVTDKAGTTSQTVALEELKKDLSEEERVAEMRARMAELGTAVLADPENNMDSLKELESFCTDEDGNVARLAMLSLLAVFKDIVPGYRIRLPTSKELEMQVSKEVRKLRDFETKLLHLYQKYVQVLTKSVKSLLHFKPALRCLCGLLEAIPHFNYRESLLSVVIPQMNSPDSLCRTMSCDTVRSLFRNEGKHRGAVTVEAVQMISDFVKENDCVLQPDTIEVFLFLSFDDDLNRRPSELGKEKGADKKGEKMKSKRQANKAKKHELAAQLRKEVEADFKESSALQDASERHRLQTQTLSAVFETYFRILKTSLKPKVHDYKATDFQSKYVQYGPRPLLKPCLDGLGKFSHLISVDFMGDLLVVLKRLAADASAPKTANVQDGIPLTSTEKLQCCIVAFRIVRSNLDALNVDLRDFYVSFYNLLLSHGFGRDECSGEVLAEAFQVMLWDCRQHDMQRVAAFVKRLALDSLQLGTADVMAALLTVQHLLQRHKKCCNLLENDGGGGAVGGNIAVFQQEGIDPDLSGALSSVLWEVTLLSRHYHPAIATLASQISVMPTMSGEKFSATLTPKDAVVAYSVSKGGFHPPVQPPRKIVKRRSYMSQHGFPFETNIKDPFDAGQMESKNSEQETGNMFASYFKVLREIKKNETLRRELSRSLRSIKLFKKFKADKLKVQKRIAGVNGV